MSYDDEYHRMMHPLDEDRGCGCKCPECYDAKTDPRCVCPECIEKGHPRF